MTATQTVFTVIPHIGEPEQVNATSWVKAEGEHVFYDGEKEVCRFISSNVFRVIKKG